MLERVLRHARECVRHKRYVVTLHAAEEALEDGLSGFDLESIILTGRIVERQHDSVTGRWKYLVAGDTVNSQRATLVVRMGVNGVLVMITVFREVDES